MKRHISIWTDGGARHNPGPAAIGGVVVETDLNDHTKQTTLHSISEYIGQATNNQAEYKALLASLNWLKEYTATKQINPKDLNLVLHTDSELLAYQVSGRYKVKHNDLQPLHKAVSDCLSIFNSFTITPIRREQNQRADKLVNQALDKAFAQSGH